MLDVRAKDASLIQSPIHFCAVSSSLRGIFQQGCSQSEGKTQLFVQTSRIVCQKHMQTKCTEH